MRYELYHLECINYLCQLEILPTWTHYVKNLVVGCSSICMKKHVFWYTTSKWTCERRGRQINTWCSMFGETVRQSNNCSSIPSVCTDRSWRLLPTQYFQVNTSLKCLRSINRCFQVHCAVCRVSLTQHAVKQTTGFPGGVSWTGHCN